MSEVRQDPVTGDRVIIARNRAERPQQFRTVAQARTAEDCPFCEGSESNTPGEIVARRSGITKPNQVGWQIRVVPNKYPAVQMDAAAPTNGQGGLYASSAAIGEHEVIIESPQHIARTVRLTEGQLTDVMLVYRDRLRALHSNQQLNHAIVFKNVGPAAGATIPHLHSQLVALPFVPEYAQRQINGASAYHRNHDSCVYCDIIRSEQTTAERIVCESDRFLVFCPFAARCPYETWIIPKNHQSRYDVIANTEVTELAELLRALLLKIDNTLDQPAYNYYLQSAPFGDEHESYCHWHLAVFPRITTLAGFEWSTGCFINPEAPEDASRQLKFAAS